MSSTQIADQLQVGARIRITEPVGYSDEPFADWREIAWLPPRDSWTDQITVGLVAGTARLRLDWPLERIEIEGKPTAQVGPQQTAGLEAVSTRG